MSAYFRDLVVPVIAAAFGAAVGSVVTPLLEVVVGAYRRRRFDPKDAHYKELLEQAKLFEGRAAKLAVFRQQLAFNPSSDRFKLAGFISKLDRHDAEWVRQTDAALLPEATKQKETECLDNARECAGLADDLLRRIFW